RARRRHRRRHPRRPAAGTELMEHAAPSFDILTTIIALPAVGALLVALVSRRRPEVSRQLAVLFTLLTGALAIWLMADFNGASGEFQYGHAYTWIESLGVGWRVGVDG